MPQETQVQSWTVIIEERFRVAMDGLSGHQAASPIGGQTGRFT